MDASLMLGFALILVTGLVISSWFTLALENYAAWRNIHVIASIAMLLIIVVKIGLHWRWIVKTAQRLFAPTPPAVASLPMQHVHASATMDRRRYLALMGAIGVATAVAISQVLTARQASWVHRSLASTLEQTSQAKRPRTSSVGKRPSSACVVRCNKVLVSRTLPALC
jgi:hypothetical protein